MAMSNVADQEVHPAKPKLAGEVRRSTETIQEFLADLVAGKTVLHVGCVDHTVSKEGSDSWLHKHLERSAKSVLGLDILESEVEEMRRRGYDVVAGNAITASLGRTFDVIVAGEIIEHIDAPGPFVANMAKHLNPDGRLVLTTPHAFFGLHFMESIFYSAADRWNDEHVGWFCPFTMGNLLARNGLEVETFYYFTRSRKLRRMMRMLHIPCYGVLASTIVAIARRKSS